MPPLKITAIIWLEDIVEKLEEKHGVRQEEVRQVLSNQPLFRLVEKGHRPGEDVYAALGRTNAGRYLTVFFVYKKDQRALVISAREMTRPERKAYERR
ncbi:MAG: BrnT family toxin [Chloroflexota bacterium]